MSLKDMPYCPHCKGLVYCDMVEIYNDSDGTSDEIIEICEDCYDELNGVERVSPEDLEWN